MERNLKEKGVKDGTLTQFGIENPVQVKDSSLTQAEGEREVTMEDRFTIKTGTVYYVWDNKLSLVRDSVIDYVGTLSSREEAEEIRKEIIAREKKLNGGL